MDIILDQTEIRKDEVVGRAGDSVAEMSREGARLETVKAMVDVFMGRMFYILMKS